MITITPTAEKALIALALYRFLTAAQMQRVGVSSDISHVRDTLRPLARVRPALIGQIDHGAVPKLGRMAVVNYLTKAGAEALANMRRVDLQQIPFAKGKMSWASDYWHRIACIDFHINLREWAKNHGHHLKRYISYYDFQGANRGQSNKGALRALTSISVGTDKAVPDGLFYLVSKGQERFYIFELSRGMDTKRVFHQLKTHCLALKRKLYQQEYKFEGTPRICWVFDTEKALQMLQQRAEKNELTMGLDRAIFFKTQEEVERDFFHGWRSCDSKQKLKPLVPI